MLKKTNEDLLSRLNSLENQLRNIKDEIKNEIITELRSNFNNATDQPSPDDINSRDIRGQIHSVMHEDRERERRKLNLCIRNFPESENEGSDDKAVLKQFIPAKLGIPAEEISTGITGTRRLGEKRPGSDRIMIITCCDLNVKRKILKNATKLKNHRTPNDKKVFIVPDMTKAQLEADKKLNEELYRRRNNNERVIIRRGRIVDISGSPETNVA